jgi:hypothetical protein
MGKPLLRVLAFSTRLNRIIQAISVVAALATGAGGYLRRKLDSFRLAGGLRMSAMPLMALVLGRLTANITGFGSGADADSSSFMRQVSSNV